MPGPLFLKKYATTSTVTSAQLATIVANSNIEKGHLYVITTTNEVAVGLTSTTYQLLPVAGGGGGSSAWGSITGTLSSQTDLQSALNAKSNTGHGHPQSDITGLIASLAGKQTNTFTQTTLSVSPAAYAYKEVVVADMSVSPSSTIECQFLPELDVENDLEGLADDDMRVWGIAETNQIRFILTSSGPFVGAYKVLYKVGS